MPKLNTVGLELNMFVYMFFVHWHLNLILNIKVPVSNMMSIK